MAVARKDWELPNSRRRGRESVLTPVPQRLKQLIMEPTRVTEYSETLIYLVFTNSHHKVVESGVFDLGLSDHSLVYCVLKSGRPRVAPKTIE